MKRVRYWRDQADSRCFEQTAFHEQSQFGGV
jgi:hypothetical protein